MSRHQADREDLLAEATALVERVELLPAAEPIPVVAGFRRDGSASLYFGADPVYQFNAAAELRRAFVDGLLYKAVAGRLAELRRQRTATASVLWRRDLADYEQQEFLSRAAERLQSLAAALESGQLATLRQIPADRDVVSRIKRWFDDVAFPLSVAGSPRVGRGS